MAFLRPTLNEIVSRMEADASSRLLSESPVLRRSFIGVLIRVFAGAIHMTYGSLVWLIKQISPQTAESEILEMHAASRGVTRLPGSFATGSIDFTGDSGSTIPAGTILQRSDGAQYKTDEETEIVGGSISVSVTAVEVGTASNATSGEMVFLTSPLDGVDQSATVSTSGINGGVDIETDNQLRARYLKKIQNPAQGGDKENYEQWALEVAGVYKPFVFPLYDIDTDTVDQPGYVSVTCITSSDNHIPSDQLIVSLQEHLELKRPITAIVKAYAPSQYLIDFEIALSPNTEPVRQAIKSEIKALFDREGAPDSTIPLSKINEAISVATGENDHVLISPTVNIVSNKWQYPIPWVDNITFSDL